jgi:hypothetical protein
VDAATLIQGLLWFVAFLFSTTVHEAAHALVALRGGDPPVLRRPAEGRASRRPLFLTDQVL